MTSNDDHFVEFRPHTEFKHLTLEYYLDSWTRKLLLRSGACGGVDLVDAFAGEGMDERGNHGSPVILAKVAERAKAQLERMEPTRSFDIRLLAIEKSRKRYKALQENLARFGPWAEPHRGELRTLLPTFIADHGDRPCMFFIDPFGVKGLESSVVQQILAVPRYELLALFNDEGAFRQIAVSASPSRDVAGEVDRAVTQPSLFGEWDERKRWDVRQKAERSNISLRHTQEGCERILTTAYGDRRWEAVWSGGGTSGQKRERLISLYRELLKEAGGLYSTVIPVRDVNGAQVYTLVHASRHAAGRQTMKEAVERAIKNCRLPDPVKDLVRDDLRIDLVELEAYIRTRYAGKRVGWTEVVRRYLLEETDVFPFQLHDLKRRLRPSGCFVDGKAGSVSCCDFTGALVGR